MMNLEQIPAILTYSLIGLAFLLALLAFVLLWTQGNKTRPSSTILRAAKAFMILSLVLGLGAGSIEVLKPTKSVGLNGMGAEISPDAQEGFLSGRSPATLKGTWTALWSMTNEEGKQVPYYDNPKEIIHCTVNRAEISCTADDPTTYLKYWLHGRISTANNVTLVYWSQRGVPEKVLTGVVFLQFPKERRLNRPPEMTGWWRGWARRDKRCCWVISGTVIWTKADQKEG